MDDVSGMHLADPTKETDRAVAHALARIGLGINLLMHGLPRMVRWREFAEHVSTQFAHPPLPVPGVAVGVVVYGIPPLETVLGVFLILGLALRPTLVAGMLALFPIILGTNLIGDYATAGTQLVYLGFYAVLLATVHGDFYSLDGWRRRHRASRRDDPCR